MTVSTQVWVQAAALFFGVLLLETGSSELNFLLCILTIITISLSLWTVADMDLPFSSNFHRVKFEALSLQLVGPTSAAKATPSEKMRKAVSSLRCAARRSLALRTSEQVRSSKRSSQRMTMSEVARAATAAAATKGANGEGAVLVADAGAEAKATLSHSASRAEAVEIA